MTRRRVGRPALPRRRAGRPGGRGSAQELRRCRVRRRGRRRAPARPRAPRSAPRGSSRSPRGRNPRAHPRSGRPRLVSGDDPELVGRRCELRSPDATVLGGTAYEHERRPLANALVGDLEPIRSDDLHRRTLYARSETSGRLRRLRRTPARDDRMSLLCQAGHGRRRAGGDRRGSRGSCGGGCRGRRRRL
jgi:hypothetical protein